MSWAWAYLSAVNSAYVQLPIKSESCHNRAGLKTCRVTFQILNPTVLDTKSAQIRRFALIRYIFYDSMNNTNLMFLLKFDPGYFHVWF